MRSLLVLLTAVVPGLPLWSQMPAGAAVQERFDWPREAQLRLTASVGPAQASSRWEAVGAGMVPTAVGISLPYLQAGPLVSRGLLRLAGDPAASYAWSGVLREPVGLVLDSALESATRGVLLCPMPGLGLFCLDRSGVDQWGGYGRLALGDRASAEVAAICARPPATRLSEEWYLDAGPYPGGELTNISGRLLLDTAGVQGCVAAGCSAARWASPGSFLLLWLRRRAAFLDCALGASGTTPGYRSSTGRCPQNASTVSAVVRIGKDPELGTLEGGCSFTIRRPGFAPRAEVPTRTTAYLELLRDLERQPDRSCTVVLQADKRIDREEDGTLTDQATCASTVVLAWPGLEARAGAGLSKDEGATARGSLAATTVRQCRLLVEGVGQHLGSPSTSLSVSASLALGPASRRATIRAGIQEVPLAGAASLWQHAFLCLSSTFRAEPALSPSPRRG